MTNREILDIAMAQSALESGCNAADFEKKENIVVEAVKNERARKYLELPFICDLTTYGNNIVASVNKEDMPAVQEYLNSYPMERSLETPLFNVIEKHFRKKGAGICFQAAYYLPNVNALREEPSKYELKILAQRDFQELYTSEWSYALCDKRKELDILGVGAYDKEGKLIGLAACSADCDTMWQIGVNVIPDYQGEGIASSITIKLAKEILDRGKVPFYRSPWCNIKSIRNAIKAGFRPAWCQMTIKDDLFIEKMTKNLLLTGRG